MIKLPAILPPPEERPSHLPFSAKWLSGEGAGSWFVVAETGKYLEYKITRFSPGGMIECEGFFYAEGKIDFKKKYRITYPSHCLIVTLIQGLEKVTFKMKELQNSTYVLPIKGLNRGFQM